jgi:hypothetical protein
MRHSLRTSILAVGWLALTVTADVTTAADEEAISRHYAIGVDVHSIVPNEGMLTHRTHCDAEMSGPGTMDDTVSFGERRFKVSVSPRFRDGRFVVTVAVEPAAEDQQTQAFTKEFDLSEFQCESVELARDADGRVYRMSLVPRVVTSLPPKSFRVSDLRMENWGFPACPIILNDQDYVGQLAGASASLAWFEMLDVGVVEFSLLHLKDAKPWGTLSGGVLNIRHENGTTVSISGVRNGLHREVLPGGPYTVWVRWKPSTMTREEYQRGLQQTLELVRSQIANGDTSFSPETLKQIERMASAEGPRMVTNGMRQARADELEPE